jgi:hypothetical protein
MPIFRAKGNLRLKAGFAPKAIQSSVALETSKVFSFPLSSSAFSSV